MILDSPSGKYFDNDGSTNKNIIHSSSIDENKRPGLCEIPAYFDVSWHQINRWKYICFVICCILSCGLLVIFCTFFPGLKRWFTTSTCNPNDASIAIINSGSRLYIQEVEHYNVESTQINVVELNCQRYFSSQDGNKSLFKIDDVPSDFKRKFIMNRGLKNKVTQDTLLAYYGLNLMKLPQANFLDILLRQIFHPFYVFQYFAVAVWISSEYILYSIVILFITAGAVYITTKEIFFNLRRLHALAGTESFIYKEIAPDKFEKVKFSTLIPGDRFLVVDGLSLPCDAILLNGRIIVDESMLTGESVPISKQPFDIAEHEEVDIEKNSNYVLFSGTNILKASGVVQYEDMKGCIAIAYRTGFRSAKGQLVASLLLPKEEFMAFFSDTFYVILLMLLITIILYAWTASFLVKLQIAPDIIFLKFLDAITIAVPPALTASLTVATAISIDRLRLKEIFVSDTARLNWAGAINTVCFDKTGTLTEEQLVFKGISIPVSMSVPTTTAIPTTTPTTTTTATDKLTFQEFGSDPNLLPKVVLELMATCNSLSVLGTSIVGDPLEKELLRASGWTLEMCDGGKLTALSGPPSSSSTHGTRYSILRHFDFVPEKLRSGSVIRRPSGDAAYLVKGSPEVIIQLCFGERPPVSVLQCLHALTQRGQRVVGMAYRNCEETDEKLMTLSQDELERPGGVSQLQYLGLAFLSSQLKNDTKSTISTLLSAKILCSMITGDHVYTAVAVAKECGLIPPHESCYIIEAHPESGLVEILDEDGRPATAPLSSSHSQSQSQSRGKSTALSLGSLLELKVSENSTVNPTVSHLAVTGRGLASCLKHTPSLGKAMYRSCRVFARMKPSDKKLIVEQLMETPLELSEALELDASVGGSSFSVSQEPRPLLPPLGAKKVEPGAEPLFVLFCGDGANDMAALRTATVGVSLCDTETSVAAPITSKMQNPGSVVEVMKEGRASLVTAFSLVSFNIMYGVIQLYMTCQLYSFGLKVGNHMYLIQDLFYTLVLGIALSVAPTAATLSITLPPQRFFSAHLLVKLFLQAMSFPLFQSLSLIVLRNQSWYERYHAGGDPLSETYSYEAAVLSSLALAQLMIASTVATIDAPFRQPWYTNIYHIGSLALQLLFLIYQIFSRGSAFNKFLLEIRPLPFDFCFVLVGIIGLNCVSSLVLLHIAAFFRPK